MKLAALGVVTAGLGVALGVPGLTGIGLFWVAAGLLGGAHARRIKQLRAEQKERNAGLTGDALDRTPVVDGRRFALGSLLLLAIGLPSLAVGLLQVGIDADHAAWRWLPIVVGGVDLALLAITVLMYAAGAGASAAAEAIGVPEAPATVWIRSVRETGAFVNERPRMEFELLVEPDRSTGMASYEVTKKATVPFTAMASLRVGDGFRALVLGPEKPTSMTIQWDSPVAAGQGVDAVASASPAPPRDAADTASTGSADVSVRLDELDRLHAEAKITDEEYQEQRRRILGSL